MNKNKFFLSVLFFCFSLFFAEENLSSGDTYTSVVTDNGYEVKRISESGTELLLSVSVEHGKDALVITLATTGSINKYKEITTVVKREELHDILKIAINLFHNDIVHSVYLSKENCVIVPVFLHNISDSAFFSKKIDRIDLDKCVVSVKKKKDGDELVIKAPYVATTSWDNNWKHKVPVTYKFEK